MKTLKIHRQRLLFFLVIGCLFASQFDLLASLVGVSIDTNSIILQPRTKPGQVYKITGELYLLVGNLNRVTVKARLRRDCDGYYWNGQQWLDCSDNLDWDNSPANLRTSRTSITYAYYSTYTNDNWVILSPLPYENQYPPGNYTIFARIDASPYSDEAQLSFTLDYGPPIVELMFPKNNQAYNFPELISIRAVDSQERDACGNILPGKGIPNLPYCWLQRQSDHAWFSGGKWDVPSYSSLLTGDGKGFYKLSWQGVPCNPCDVYDFKVEVEDSAFAWKQWTLGHKVTLSCRFILDQVPPFPPVFTSPSGTNELVTSTPVVSGTALDNYGGSGIARVTLVLVRPGTPELPFPKYWDGTNWAYFSGTPVAGALIPKPTELPTTFVLKATPLGYAPVVYWTKTTGWPTGGKLTNGNYLLTAIAYDRAGNASASTRIPITVQLNAPFGLFSGRSAGGGITNLSGTFGVGGNASVLRVDLFLINPQVNPWQYWNGSAWQADRIVLPTSLAQGDWRYTGVLPSELDLGDGLFLLQTVVSDSQGNTNMISKEFWVDRTPPGAPTFDSPTNGATFISLPPLISGTAMDSPNGNGLDRVDLRLSYSLRIGVDTIQMYWNGTTWQDAAINLETVISGTNWACVAAPPADSDLLDRLYTLEAVAVDQAGNTGAWNSAYFLIDSAAPTVTISAPTNSITSLSMIIGTAADNIGGSGVARVEIAIQDAWYGTHWDGASWVQPIPWLAATLTGWDWTISGWDWTLADGLPNPLNLPNGSYILTARAYDLAGNSNRTDAYFTMTGAPSTNPVPVLTDLYPATRVFVGDPAFELYPTGSNFVQGSMVFWNGTNQPALFLNDRLLLIQVDATNLTVPSTNFIYVFNPAPMGGYSATQTFTVLPRPVVPNDNFANRLPLSGYYISATGSNAGASAEPGEPDHYPPYPASRSVWWKWTAPADGLVTISTAGSTFNTMLAVYTGANLTSLTCIASNNDVDWTRTSRLTFDAAAGTEYQIAVDSRFWSEYGDISLSLDENPPNERPQLFGVVPNMVLAGGPPATVSVYGSNFMMGAMFFWNGTNGSMLFPTLVNSRELTVTIPAELIATASTNRVSVATSASCVGGLWSPYCFSMDDLTFFVLPAPPAPAVTRLEPNILLGGGGEQILRVIGANFATNSIVRWNGQDRPTRFDSPTQLTALIASDLLGSAEIRVFTPSPGGGLSGPLALTTTGLNLGSCSWNNGQFRFQLTGPPGQRAVILTSQDLLNWLPIFTNDMAGGQTNWLETNTLNSRMQFYRGEFAP